MKTAIKLLSALVCIILITGLFAPVWAADMANYTVGIPCRYDGNGSRFHGGLAAVQNAGKAGLIDKGGNVVAEFVYDSLYPAYVYPSGPQSLPSSYFIAIQNGKWGVLDKSGKPVIPSNYDSITVTGGGFAIVGKGEPRPPGGGTINGLWGLIDLKSGKEILPVKYNSILPSDDSLLFTVFLDNKSGVVDRSGKFIAAQGIYEYISVFNSGFAVVQKDNKFGVINKNGQVVIPVIYNRIDQFYNGIALAIKGNKYGVLNTSGQPVIPFNYDDGGIASNGAIYMRQKSKTVIFDNRGKVIAPAGTYDSFYNVAINKINNLIFVERGGKVGAIDMTGKQIVPFIYTGVRESNEGLAIVIANDKSAVINQSGKIILPLDKYGLLNLRENGCILVVSAKNGKWGLIDQNGKTVLPYEYYGIGPMNDNYVVANNEKGCAVFNKDGDIIVPFGDFDFIGYYVSENMVDVRKNGLTGYINLPEYIAPPDYWAKPEVDRAIAAGLVPEDMRKNYQDNITRADFCRLAVNLIEMKTGMKVDEFMDTRGMSGRVYDPIAFTDTADPYILAASRLGIVKGVGNNNFDPTGKIIRQDAAVMLRQTANVLDFTEPSGTSVSFADSHKFSSYAVDAIAFVSAAADKESGIKVMGGTGNNIFSPQANYTRQQAYITILRLFNAIG